MKSLQLRSVVLFIILALLLTACNIDLVETYCDSVTVHYTVDSQVSYAFAAYLEDGTRISDIVSGTTDTDGTQTHPLYGEYPAGTLIHLRGTGNAGLTEETAPVACTPSGTGGDGGSSEAPVVITWFEPGDDRINQQAYASAAIYCDADNSRMLIYGIDDEGHGTPAITMSYADLPVTPSADAGNQLIAQSGLISLYRLTTGEYQVNAGPDAEGKSYVAIWDGCPQSYLNAYTLQNGIMTPAEHNEE